MKRVGDKQKAICVNCKGLRMTTMGYKDVNLGDTGIIAKKLLVGSCDSCGHVILMPHQSATRVKEVLEAEDKSNGG